MWIEILTHRNICARSLHVRLVMSLGLRRAWIVGPCFFVRPMPLCKPIRRNISAHLSLQQSWSQKRLIEHFVYWNISYSFRFFFYQLYCFIQVNWRKFYNLFSVLITFYSLFTISFVLLYWYIPLSGWTISFWVILYVPFFKFSFFCLSYYH